MIHGATCQAGTMAAGSEESVMSMTESERAALALTRALIDAVGKLSAAMIGRASPLPMDAPEVRAVAAAQAAVHRALLDGSLARS